MKHVPLFFKWKDQRNYISISVLGLFVSLFVSVSVCCLFVLCDCVCVCVCRWSFLRVAGLIVCDFRFVCVTLITVHISFILFSSSPPSFVGNVHTNRLQMHLLLNAHC